MKRCSRILAGSSVLSGRHLSRAPPSFSLAARACTRKSSSGSFATTVVVTDIALHLATTWPLYPTSCFSDHYGRYLLYNKRNARSLPSVIVTMQKQKYCTVFIAHFRLDQTPFFRNGKFRKMVLPTKVLFLGLPVTI